jgi:hypothetical protein
MLTGSERRFLARGLVSAVLAALVVLAIAHMYRRRPAAPTALPEQPAAVPAKPLRPMPDTFKRNTHLPSGREGDVSGSIDLSTFSAGRDLVYVDDPRVWWESDHDGIHDTECDHSIHRSLEEPLRRLIELVAARGGTLEVHDAYRATGIHNIGSLHKEGRAVDVTCDQMPLEELAKLCWAAGFDWVYYEARGGGPHVHCSVRR